MKSARARLALAVAVLCSLAAHAGRVTVAAQQSASARTPSARRAAENDLRRTLGAEESGFVSEWLISAPQPSEVSAGAYENLQRFNIERLPETDWLARFGGAARIEPRPGVMRADADASTQNPAAPAGEIRQPRADVPEAGSEATRQTAELSDRVEWRPYRATSPRLDFAALNNAGGGGARPVGTAYAAAYITSPDETSLFVETDGFIGSIHLNGERIYDGFRLDPPRTHLIRLRAGRNLLLVRATGVTGDYWRKDGGWTAMLRLWRARDAGGGLLAGALRTNDSYVEDGAATREALRMIVANRGVETRRDITIELGAGANATRLALDELAAGELRDVELRSPFADKPEAQRRDAVRAARSARVRVTTPDTSLAWNATWTSASLSPAGTIFYLEGFHVDPVYLHDQHGYSRITLSNTNQYLRSLRADPSYGVFLSEIDYLKPYDDTHPEDRAVLREAIRAGRVGTGGSYNQFNELTISGESIIRNILYGEAYHAGVLGDSPTALALWDVFGHAPQISQIARKSGFAGIVWSKKIPGFPSFFYDYALDGSRLLHRRLDYAYSFSGFGSGKNYSLDDFRRTTERKFAEARSLGSSVDLRINAADFTPPWTNLAGNAARLAENRPRIVVTGQAQSRYLEALRNEIDAGKVSPPVTSRDKLFFHVGVAAARSDLKVAHRKTENMTLTAERFGALASSRGAPYPDRALDKAWRQILFGSHHDAITGTPSDNALLDLVHGYREAYELSRDALGRSLKYITAQIDTRPKFADAADTKIKPLVVFNPMSWTRTDVVRARIEPEIAAAGFRLRDAQGERVPFRMIDAPHRESDMPGGTAQATIEFVARDVPSLGYKTFYVEPLAGAQRDGVGAGLVPARRLRVENGGQGQALPLREPPTSAADSSDTIENEFYRVRVDPARGGAISSIYDKRAGREIVRANGGHLANEIAALKEELTKKNVIYPAWEFWTTGERRFSTEAPAEITIESAAASHSIVVEGALPGMRGYRQTISLHDGVPRVDLRTELLGYTGQSELFVVNFPVAPPGSAFVVEDRFGAVTRNSSKGFLDFRSNTDKLVSGAPVYSAYNWVEAGATLTLDFIGAAGESAASVPVRPVALVRPHGAAREAATERIVSALIRRGVSCTPLFDDDDRERRASLSIEDSTVPRSLNDDISYHSFRIALGAASENAYTRRLLARVDPEARTAFERRLARDRFAYLFALDRDVPSGWQPVPALVIAGQTADDERRAIETLLATSAKGEHKLRLPAETIADRTGLPPVAPAYGVALVNNGNIAASFERPDTLTLFLTHTASFPGVNLPFAFTPEHKTHVFDYALYPHAGDWREANTTRTGYDFNNQLIALETDAHAGELPNAHSFLSIDNPRVVLSALKVSGNPQATFRLAEGEGARSLVARFYETTGADARATVTTDEPLAAVRRTDLLEKEVKDAADVPAGSNRGGFEARLDGFGIETYKITSAKPRAPSQVAVALGRVVEGVQPVPSRYWLHNAGAAPLGNDPLKITLRLAEGTTAPAAFAYDDAYNQGGTTTLGVQVQIVNNLLDRPARGVARLEAAPGWRVHPDRITYDIAPGGFQVADAVVVAYPVKQGDAWERASGLVKARLEHDGQTYQDVLGIGKPLNLTWDVERGEQAGVRGVIVRIRNPHRQSIEGALALIAPPEAWALGADERPAAEREQGFTIEPGGEATLFFPVDARSADGWMIARLVYNGFVEYKRADSIAASLRR